MTVSSRDMGAIVVAGGVALALSMLAPAEALSRTPVNLSVAGAPVTDGRIAFVDFSSGVLDTVNPDGSALVQVTDPTTDGFVNGRAGWTPDGSRLVYTASRNDGPFTVYSIREDGTDRRREVPNGGDFFDFAPLMTPNGRLVLFDRCRPDPPGGCGLFSAHLHGKPRIRAIVGYAPKGKEWFTGLFAISPGGTKVAVTRGGFRGITQQVWVAGIDGSHLHPVSAPPREFAVSDWTPDGHLVVNGPNAHLGSRLYVMPATGGQPSLIASGPFPHANFFGDASPSGDRVAFLGDEDFPDLSGNHLYLVNPNGTGRIEVDTGVDFVGAPSWGTAPLQSARATGRAVRSPAMTQHQRRALEARIPAYLRGLLGPTR
jgi:hypothetical protein